MTTKRKRSVENSRSAFWAALLFTAFAGLYAKPASAQEAVLSFLPSDEAGGADTGALVQQALAANPRLQRLQFQAQAARERAPQLRAWPDPSIGANVFGNPIETAAGSQRANLTVAQKIPWLHRLNAQGKQALLEAEALEQLVMAERLLTASRVRIAVYQLYLITQKMRINSTNQIVLKSLTATALSRVKFSQASRQRDVSRATLEYSQLRANLLRLNQQLVTVKARLNELLNRPADMPVTAPKSLATVFDGTLSLDELRDAAFANQPELASTMLRQEATRLGIRIAALQQVPDLSVNFATFFIDGNRPPSRIVDVGQDAWSAGVMVNIPLWRKKYKAMQREATAKMYAATALVQETMRRYEAAIAETLEMARTAKKTTEIFDKSIVPQARLTFNADRQAYQLGKVEFDRLMTDFRNTLSAEIGYHEAVSQLATAEAQLEQLVGIPLHNVLPACNATGGIYHGPSP